MIDNYLNSLALINGTCNLYLYGGSILYDCTILEIEDKEIRFSTTFPDQNGDTMIAEMILQSDLIVGIGLPRVTEASLAL